MGLDRAEGGNSNWHHREWHTLLVQIVEGNNTVMGNGGMQQLLRLSEEDVALDMDEVIVEVEELSHSDEDLDDSESGG